MGPIFYNGALNGQRYHNFLQNEIENLLEELPLETYLSIMWQQDGAPPHTIQAGTITWAPNSTELLHFGSFFWGHLKNEAFQQGNCSEVGLQIKADYF